MDDRKFSEDLEIAISGGGFRATAFGLGVLLYLMDSGLNGRVKSISSVSGGSITNGFIASQCDFGSLTDKREFRQVAARLAHIITGKNKLDGFWWVTRPYLAFLLVSGVPIMFWSLNIFTALLALAFWDVELRPISPTEITQLVVVGVFWGIAALNRGELVQAWISRSFFHGKSNTLGLLSGRKIDHIFCATDMTGSAPFFFSTKGGGRVFHENYGRGQGKDVRLTMAVTASAAFPPLIPPMRFTLEGRDFIGGKESPPPPRYVYLSDGGVWNNLATDWSRLRQNVGNGEFAWAMRTQQGLEAAGWLSRNCPTGKVLLIANASKPEKRKNLWTLKVPILSFIITIIRVLNIAVNSTVQARSADIERTTRLRMLNNPERWELNGVPLREKVIWGEGEGSDPPLVIAADMTRKPGETAKAWAMIGGLTHWEAQPGAYREELKEPLQELNPLLEGDDVIPTTLDTLGTRKTLRMIVLGYLNTREVFAVAFANHVPPPIPKREWFEELVGDSLIASKIK